MSLAVLLYAVYFIVGCILIHSQRKANLVLAFEEPLYSSDTETQLMEPYAPIETNFEALITLADEVVDDTDVDGTENSELENRISNYEARSFSALREIAKNRGMKGYSALRKAALAERLAQDDLTD